MKKYEIEITVTETQTPTSKQRVLSLQVPESVLHELIGDIASTCDRAKDELKVEEVPPATGTLNTKHRDSVLPSALSPSER